MGDFETLQSREAGLKRKLTGRQMSMIAIGGAIGTGLFLGSKIAISLAGPGILISYAFTGVVTLMLMGCLAEMTVQHTTSGSFGAYAEYYINPLAGFMVKYCYWASIVLGVGTEVTAVATYMQFWFQGTPGWIWIVLFSAILIGVNAYSVKLFGTFEYWFSTIKIYAIVAFILIGIGIIIHAHNPAEVVHNVMGHGGFLPKGWQGVWFASIIAIFSYFSIEMIAVAAAESETPEKSVRTAFKATIWRLVVFYLFSLAIVITLVPWVNVIAKGASSPYVTVMQHIGIPYAGSLINFVVIVASLSSMDSMLYVSSRMLFSLARAHDAPRALGRIQKNGIPLYALGTSASGIAVAAVIYSLFPATAFALMVALAMFGAMFAWGMIFLTHFFFRRKVKLEHTILKFRMPGYPYTTIFGLCSIAAILVSSWFTTQFHLMLVFGVPFSVLLVVVFVARKARRGRA